MDKSNKIPLYLQLIEEIKEKIENQTYREHEKLPSERELCDRYELSRITVRQALQALEQEGYIYKLHGKGTFVSQMAFKQDLKQLYSFTDEMRKKNKNPKSNVLEFQQKSADEKLMTAMRLEEGEAVYEVIRLRLADEEPLIYETSYIPQKFFPGLTKQCLIEKPMYEVFEEDYQRKVTRVEEDFSATSAGELEAGYLELAENQPVMLIRRFAYHKEQLIEYTISVARGDKFNYRVELT
ncbi:GntR family transcriptional regulator [Oceanobacillus neutriphilus]|uniref:GntR family transcriptional regulator n=1 Tax=Oceanobacillus neutriphilus TaxID=531815 RepID=A0ABQ2NP92_9BACI|nr:GntR family transcriptional regulator [Oceanobacillus neutriphilus]GGP07465.1 GntR family transcriptional regulator [Oceanobacillus neutriphilus]